MIGNFKMPIVNFYQNGEKQYKRAVKTCKRNKKCRLTDYCPCYKMDVQHDANETFLIINKTHKII